MAQGDKFQMAVAYPVMNPSFSLQNRATGTLDTAYTTGTALSTNGVDPDQGSTTLNFLDLVFKVNDRIVVGPSANTTDINKSESAIISGFEGSQKDFTLDSALSFDYEINDKYSGIGSALAGGWYLTGNAINSNTEADVILGNFDNYAQEIIAANTVNSLDLIQDLDISFLEDNIIYRFGFVYKFTDASDGSGEFQLLVGGAIALPDISESTSFISLTASVSQASWVAPEAIVFRLKNPGSGAAKKLTMVIDETYMEHTFGDFSGKRTIIPITNAGFGLGYYEFAEDLDLGSLKMTQRLVEQELKFPNGKTVWFDKSGEGDRIEKYDFGCKFSNVSQSFYDVLLEFLRLQKKGHSINIHPNIDDLPSSLRGHFKIGAVTKNQWDLSLRSFDFEFKEI